MHYVLHFTIPSPPTTAWIPDPRCSSASSTSPTSIDMTNAGQRPTVHGNNNCYGQYGHSLTDARTCTLAAKTPCASRSDPSIVIVIQTRVISDRGCFHTRTVRRIGDTHGFCEPGLASTLIAQGRLFGETYSRPPQVSSLRKITTAVGAKPTVARVYY